MEKLWLRITSKDEYITIMEYSGHYVHWKSMASQFIFMDYKYFHTLSPYFSTNNSVENYMRINHNWNWSHDDEPFYVFDTNQYLWMPNYMLKEFVYFQVQQNNPKQKRWCGKHQNSGPYKMVQDEIDYIGTKLFTTKNMGFNFAMPNNSADFPGYNAEGFPIVKDVFETPPKIEIDDFDLLDLDGILEPTEDLTLELKEEWFKKKVLEVLPKLKYTKDYEKLGRERIRYFKNTMREFPVCKLHGPGKVSIEHEYDPVSQLNRIILICPECEEERNS